MIELWNDWVGRDRLRLPKAPSNLALSTRRDEGARGVFDPRRPWGSSAPAVPCWRCVPRAVRCGRRCGAARCGKQPSPAPPLSPRARRSRRGRAAASILAAAGCSEMVLQENCAYRVRGCGAGPGGGRGFVAAALVYFRKESAGGAGKRSRGERSPAAFVEEPRSGRALCSPCDARSRSESRGGAERSGAARLGDAPVPPSARPAARPQPRRR